MLEQIISGGQTGVDRAALDVALEMSVRIGGWCPKGRRAEDGVIAERYVLKETVTTDYATRTAWNVRDSDATLILNIGELYGGTQLTIEYAQSYNKPHFLVQLDCQQTSKQQQLAAVESWLEKENIACLNIAGPRASKQSGVYKASIDFLRSLLKNLLG